MNKIKLHIFAWCTAILLQSILMLMTIDEIKQKGNLGMYAAILLFFCGQLLGSYLFFNLFNIKHEGWKRLSIFIALSGGIISFLYFEQNPYHEETETFLHIDFGIAVFSLIINSIHWVYKGFIKNN